MAVEEVGTGVEGAAITADGVEVVAITADVAAVGVAFGRRLASESDLALVRAILPMLMPVMATRLTILTPRPLWLTPQLLSPMPRLLWLMLK
jgi:hypothetical protein